MCFNKTLTKARFKYMKFTCKSGHSFIHKIFNLLALKYRNFYKLQVYPSEITQEMCLQKCDACERGFLQAS